jgi:hypothetical protein
MSKIMHIKDKITITINLQQNKENSGGRCPQLLELGFVPDYL